MTSDADRLDPDAHRAMRESVGAWVLGALDGSARREVAAHVDTCPACAAEVASLSPLPGLLSRLSEEEALGGTLLPDEDFPKRLAAAGTATRAGLHRRLARWRWGALGAGVVAAALAVVLVARPGAPAEEPVREELVAAAEPVADAADATTGQAATYDWEWGTTVELDLAHLPAREAYVVWVVADDGRREQAGTWGTTRSGGARVYGASSIPRDRVERIEVTAADGELLLTFAFPAAVGAES